MTIAQHKGKLMSMIPGNSKASMGIHSICTWVRSVSICYRPWNSRKI